MNIAVVVACALVAGTLGAAVPTLIRYLPEASSTSAEGQTAPSYAELARTRGLTLLTMLISATAGAAFGWRLGESWLLLGLVPLAPVLVMLGVIDWRTRRLPKLVVLSATGATLILLVLEWAITHETGTLIRAVAAMLAARTLFWLGWYLKPAAVGFGDVRLAALTGLVLGRLSWAAWAAGLYAGLILFALFGITQLTRTRSRAGLRHDLPYGPWMAAGLLAGVLLAG